MAEALRQAVGLDTGLGQFAESGIHAVDRLTGGNNIGNRLCARLDRGPAGWIERERCFRKGEGTQIRQFGGAGTNRGVWLASSDSFSCKRQTEPSKQPAQRVLFSRPPSEERSFPR